MVMLKEPPDRHTDAAEAGAAMMPLSKQQKRALCMLAQRAYAVQDKLGLTCGLSLADWRHLEQFEACGKAHLPTCTNADYLKIHAHLLDLAGEEPRAQTERVRAGCEPRAWAMARLREECRKAADVLPGAIDYARGFVKNKRGCLLESASARDIWHAIYVVRRRAQQLRRKARAEREGGGQ